MLKVAVFDSGWGGEMFADKLERAVPVLEVERVIDWRRAPYCTRGRTEICELAEKALKPYIGEVDVIVLASYTVTGAALHYLEWKYPEQRFVGFTAGMSGVALRAQAKKILMLAPGMVRESWGYKQDLRKLHDAQLVRPECEKWVTMVDDGEMTEEKVRKELGELAEERVEAVLLYATGFVELEPMLKRIYGPQTLIVDEFSKVIRETCAALRLKGGTGGRG